MDGTFIDVVIKKLQWLFDHPEVTWSGSGIYALSLAGSAALAVASWCFWRKKKFPPSSEEHLRQPLPAQNITNQFNSDGGEQNIAQGDHATGKLVNNHGPVISTSGNQSPAIQGRDVTVNYNNLPPDWMQYAEEFGVTKAAIASFFKILEQEKVQPGDLDSKLREIAFRYKELLLRFEAVTSDDPQVQALKEQAKQAIEKGEYDRADALLNQAKERDRAAVATLKASLAEQQAALEKRQLSEVQSCVSQANLQRLQYRYEKSAQYYQEAAAALPEGYEGERAEYFHAAGHDLDNIARYGQAMFLYEQSLSMHREIGNRKGEAESLNNIGGIYWAQGNYKKALYHLEQSLPIRRDVRDKKGEGVTLNNIALLYDAKGNYAKALKYFEQSLSLAREINDKEVEGATLNNIGEIYRQQGNHAAALQYYEHALVISREIKNKHLESRTLNNMGLVYKAQDKLDAALEQYKQSLAIKQQIGDRQGEVATLNNIATIYKTKGNYAAALKQCEQALAIAKEIGAKAEEASGKWNIGLLYKKQGELAKAELYLSRALELKEQLEAANLEKYREGLKLVRTTLWVRAITDTTHERNTP